MKPTGKTKLRTGAVCALTIFLATSTALPRPQRDRSAALLADVVPAGSGKLRFALDPAQSKVHWTLETTLHTVHGTFAFARGHVQFDPATGKADGEMVVDAASGESGNGSRDKRMHAEILESGRYGEVVFHPQIVKGTLAVSGASALQVQGVFVLHGREHEMELPLHTELSGKLWKGTAKFSVPYIQWGLKNPGNFLLKVKHNVEIELEMSGTLENALE